MDTRTSRGRHALSAGALRALIRAGRHQEVTTQAVRIESRTNLLFSFEKMALRRCGQVTGRRARLCRGPVRFPARPRRRPGALRALARCRRKRCRATQTRVLTWPVLNRVRLHRPTRSSHLPQTERHARRGEGVRLRLRLRLEAGLADVRVATGPSRSASSVISAISCLAISSTSRDSSGCKGPTNTDDEPSSGLRSLTFTSHALEGIRLMIGAPATSTVVGETLMRYLTGVVILIAASVACSHPQNRAAASPTGPECHRRHFDDRVYRGRLGSDGRAVSPTQRVVPVPQRSRKQVPSDGTRSLSTTYVDREGEVVWMQEYIRYRVNGCDHNTAIQRVFAQIDGGPVGGNLRRASRGRHPLPVARRLARLPAPARKQVPVHGARVDDDLRRSRGQRDLDAGIRALSCQLLRSRDPRNPRSSRRLMAVRCRQPALRHARLHCRRRASTS